MADAVPKKQRTLEYIGLAVFVMVALVLGITRFKKGDIDDEVFSRKEFDKKWEDVKILEAKVPKIEKDIVYNITDDKIPFKGPIDDESTKQALEEDIVLPALTFQGMIWKSFRPQAIINGKIYDVNDTIGEGEESILVKAILQDGIHLIYKGKEFIGRPK